MAGRHALRQVHFTPEQRKAHAYNALCKPKRIDRSAADIVHEASTLNGRLYPSSDPSERWRVRFYRVDDMMRAQLFALGTAGPILSLDHHRGRAMDMFDQEMPPGFHWDIYWPFLGDGVAKARIRIDNRFDDSYEVVEFVAWMWSLELRDSTQARLRWQRI